MKKTTIIMVLCGVLAMAGCSTRRVERVDPRMQIDLSGRWNDTDSRMVSLEMIEDSLARVWLTDFIEANSKKPTVIVGLVKNKSHELISTDVFIKDMERAFINSGKVRVVQAGAAREELRDEREDQQNFASPATMKKWGMELGADFILQGVINTIVDSGKRDKLVFYQIDLELTNIQTNEKVWLGTKEIKKVISN